MTFEIIPNYGKYNKPILFVLLMTAVPMIIIPQITNDVNFITYSGTSFLAILIAGLAIIIARVFSDRTSNEIKSLSEKIDEIHTKLQETTINPPHPPPPINLEQLPHIIKEWEIVIQTQMHFNDLLIKVRSATISVVLAIFGAGGYSILSKETFLLTINGFTLHPSVLIILSGIILLISMFIIDYGYYYKMLIGAVRRGIQFDDEFRTLFGRKYFGMTTMIRDEIGRKGKSKIFVISFYSIPLVAGIFFLLGIFIGFPITTDV